MKFFVFLATFLFVIHSFAQTIATIGSRKISKKEFDDRYRDVVEQTVNPPSKTEFLEDLIRYEVGLQEAKKIGLQNDPAVKERMNQELYKAMIEKSLSDKVEKINVTEAEMKKYYQSNPEIRTSHILTEIKPDATAKQIEAARKRAQQIYAQVKKSKRPFNDLVRLYSDDPISKRNGGDIGWQTRLTLVPNYYNAAIRMKQNQVLGIIKTQFGYHIIKMTGKRSYKDADKRNIRMAVFDLKRKTLFDRYFEQLKKKYRISINSKNI